MSVACSVACSVTLQCGPAVWPCSVAMQCGPAVWPCGVAGPHLSLDKQCVYSEPISDIQQLCKHFIAAVAAATPKLLIACVMNTV